MVSHNYSYLGAYSFALTLSRGVRFECDMKLVAFLPLIYHIADQIFSLPAWLCGGTLVIGRKHDPAGIARALSDERATALWSGSPAMLEELANELEANPELDASALTARGLRLDGDRARTGRAAQAADQPGADRGRDPRPDRGDLLLPLLARQMAGDLRRERAGSELRRRPQPDGRRRGRRRGGQAAGGDGRASRARSSTARRS